MNACSFESSLFLKTERFSVDLNLTHATKVKQKWQVGILKSNEILAIHTYTHTLIAKIEDLQTRTN